ncbi:OPT family oligopeptide transporter [Rickettsiella endosymbiont of Miltochrista miniata]|uniref:OPT family oligopeptide transporter n=1 Tax=Rickettsiella endosymbiont of Miltochrista miniata TaxID=3066239 RepID=UPI00313E811A
MQEDKKQSVGVITLRVIVLGIFLAILLAASSTYLALKVGILPSASIPAAILAMSILRLFHNGNIFEANLIQTAASAGEAVAGGIVFTIPALVIIGYWHYFPYFANCAIALLGGLLGILFSIPLRKILINTPQLYFPEARAISEVLQLSQKQSFHIKKMLVGTSLGAGLEFAQTGLKVIAVSTEKWIVFGQTNIIGFGFGFAPALIGVGYLIGWNVGLSLLLGAFVAWGITLPLLSYFIPAGNTFILAKNLTAYASDIHYIGLGAMLAAGLWTLLNLFHPFYLSLRLSLQGLFQPLKAPLLPTEQDIPLNYLLAGLGLVIVSIYFLFDYLLPIHSLMFSLPQLFIIGAVLYVLVIGFVFAALCGYFSGLVGVTASPGSAIVISGLLFMALILRLLLFFKGHELLSSQLLNAAAVTIIIGAVVAGAACIANDNIQDLKVGHLIGAAPWQQQVMLILGVLIAALVIPMVMQLLFNVYGLTNVLPHAGMDLQQSLSAPPAAMMAGLTQGVFNHDLPWNMLGLGAAIMLVLILVNTLTKINISLLGVGMGIYLPLSSSTPLFIGSLFAYSVKLFLQKKIDKGAASQPNFQQHDAILLSCGLVAGAALMDVLLAIPLSITGNTRLFAIFPVGWQALANLLGFLSLLGLAASFYWAIHSKKITPRL